MTLNNFNQYRIQRDSQSFATADLFTGSSIRILEHLFLWDFNLVDNTCLWIITSHWWFLKPRRYRKTAVERTAPHMAVVNTSSSRSLRCKRFQKAEEGGTVADDARLSIRFHFLTARFTFQPHTFASSIHSEIHVHVHGGQPEKSCSLGN